MTYLDLAIYGGAAFLVLLGFTLMVSGALEWLLGKLSNDGDDDEIS